MQSYLADENQGTRPRIKESIHITPDMEPDMPDTTLPRHHIHKLTRLAAVLDRQGRHAEADRLDRVVRRAQWFNPIRTLKNWQNANEINSNQSDPADILRLIQLNLSKLWRNSQAQGWFVGLDPLVRPTVVKLIGDCSRMLADYANAFNQQPPLAPTSSRSPQPVRLADLAGGLDRDINDVLNLLSSLTDTRMFPRGDALYAAIQARLKTVDDLLLGNVTPQQAAAQTQGPSAAPASTGTGFPAAFARPTGPQSPASGADGQSSPVGQNGAYSYAGETYNSVHYLQQERVPGSPEWDNEVQNYLGWGVRNGGLQNLLAKMQQDQHTSQFIAAVQQAWNAKGLPTAPIRAQGTVGSMSAAVGSAQKPSAY